MIDHNFMLHKVKEQNIFFGTETPIQAVETTGANALQEAAQKTREDYERIETEALDVIDRFWGNDSKAGYDSLMATAHHYDLSRAYTEDPQEITSKNKIRDELTRMSEISSVRKAGKRLDHMKDAKKNYEKAASNFRKMKTQMGNGGIGYISAAEDTITRMIEGEIELVKAEGLKDKTEEYKLARLYLKKNMMFLKLYQKALNQNVSERNRASLNSKVEKVNARIAQLKNSSAALFAEKAISWKDADTFGGNNVMNYKQFNAFAKKVCNPCPERFADLKEYFNIIDENKNLHTKDNDKYSPQMQLNSLRILTNKCIEFKKVFKRNKNAIKVLDVLQTQCTRKSESLMRAEMLRVQKVNKSTIDNENDKDYDKDEFSDYKQMTEEDYVDYVVENEYNFDFSEQSLYESRPEWDDLKGENPNYMYCNSTCGYIASQKAKFINLICRLGTSKAREYYYAEQVNVKLNLEGEKAYKSLSKQEALKIPGIDAKNVSDWQEGFNIIKSGFKETDSSLSEATSINKAIANNATSWL